MPRKTKKHTFVYKSNMSVLKVVPWTTYFTITETPYYTEYIPIDAVPVTNGLYTTYINPSIQIVETTPIGKSIKVVIIDKIKNKQNELYIPKCGVYITYPMPDHQIIRQYK